MASWRLSVLCSHSFPLLSLLSVLSACSIQERLNPSSQLQVSMRETIGASPLDESARRSAQSMHHFIVGQLSLMEGNVAGAVSHLTQASDLHGAPIAVLNVPLAELLLRKGQVQQAKAELEKSLQAEQGNADAAMLLAGILDAEESLPRARELYQGVINNFPQRFDAYVLLSFSFERAGDGAKAISVLERLVRQFPKESISHALLSRVYELDRRYQPAERALRVAMELEPANKTYAVELVRILLKAGKLSEARALCDKLAKEDPQNTLLQRLLEQLQVNRAGENVLARELLQYSQVPLSHVEAHLRAAVYLLERKNFEEARQQLTLVLAVEPLNDQARFYLGSLLAGGGRRKEAVEELLQISPEQDLYLKSRTFAAFVLRQDGDLVGAEKAAREALEQDPQDMSILAYLVALLRDQKKYPEALTLTEQAIKAEPSNERLHFNYAVLLSDAGREVDARAAMERVLALNPEHADALNFVAYSLAESAIELPHAKELIERALAIRPSDGYFLDTLGFIYLLQGELPKALSTLERATQIVGDDAAILEHYGDVLVALGRFEEAGDQYRSALEFGRDAKDEIDEELIERVEKKLRQLNKNR